MEVLRRASLLLPTTATTQITTLPSPLPRIKVSVPITLRPTKCPWLSPCLCLRSFSPRRFYYSGRTELQAVQENNKQRSRLAKVFVRSPSKRLNGHGTDSQSSTLNNSNTNGNTSGGSSEVANNNNGKPAVVSSLGNKVTSKQSGTLPRKAWEQQSEDNSLLLEQGNRFESPVLPSKQQQLQSQQSTGAATNGQSLHFSAMESGHVVLNEEGLVNVRLVADDQGRFGFNVKGGADLQLPVLVSRVAPNTPADQSTPRISEGDQVVMINGRDISALKHEQIVSLIRASREFRGGELVLTIKPQGE